MPSWGPLTYWWHALSLFATQALLSIHQLHSECFVQEWQVVSREQSSKRTWVDTSGVSRDENLTSTWTVSRFKIFLAGLFNWILKIRRFLLFTWWFASEERYSAKISLFGMGHWRPRWIGFAFTTVCRIYFILSKVQKFSANELRNNSDSFLLCKTSKNLISKRFKKFIPG